MRSPLLLLLVAVACRTPDPRKDAVDDTGAADSGCARPADLDGDGWDDRAQGGLDCDDLDPAVHPGADDPAGDGLDADCDGADGPLACVPTAEVCNNVDDDCDGRVDDDELVAVTLDRSVATVGRLLAGAAPALVVGTEGEGTDGAIRVYDADGVEVLHLVGVDQSPSFGTQVGAGRDLTGDGLEDLVVAAPYATTADGPNAGRVFVLPGPIGPATTLADAAFTFEGGELDGQAGGQLALLPDLTGDGLADLAVGYYRHVVLLPGGSTGPLRLADAFATWELPTGGGAWHFATVPDLDGDGLPELALGMPTYGSGGGLVARWDSATLAGAHTLDDAAASLTGVVGQGLGDKLTAVDGALWTVAEGQLTAVSWTGTTPTGVPTSSIVAAGDLDGDGRGELVLNDAGNLVTLSDGAEIGRLPGSYTLQTDRADQPARDHDGDGLPDLPVLDPGRAVLLAGIALTGGGCDADGDGVAAAAGDCDDADPEVRALASRERPNGRDDDCDGAIDSPVETWQGPAPAWLATGEAAVLLVDEGEARLVDPDGNEIARLDGARADIADPAAILGDADGDGAVELLFAREGEVVVTPAVDGEVDALAVGRLEGGGGWTVRGEAGGAGDVDGDGLADAWALVEDADGVLALAVYPGLAGGDRDAGDAAARFTTPDNWAGMTVAGGADLDGDGLDDLLAGNPTTASGAGRVLVFLDLAAGPATIDDAALRLFGDPEEALGGSIAVGADLDGDGRPDAVLGSPSGARWLYGGPCPEVRGPRADAGADHVAFADLGRGPEAYFADPEGTWGPFAGGVVARGTPGAAPAPWRVGEGGDALGSGLWGAAGGLYYVVDGDLWRAAAP